MIKKNKIPTLLGIVILVVGTFAGVFFLGMKQIFRIGADSSVAPQDIRVSNTTDNSATISWTTDKPTSDFLLWGESSGSITKLEKETENDQKFSSHSITLTGLKPSSKYFYKINSDGEEFDNKGIPWDLTTGTQLNISTGNSLISGTILTASGQPVSRSLVYANIGGYLMSTLTSDTGNFVFQLASARSQDLESYQLISEAETLVQISVSGGAEGATSAQVFPQSAKPMPPMILGQVYDFRNLEPSPNSSVPDAKLNLPENTSKESKFYIPIVSGTPSPTSVILESLKEGEIVTSDKPAFFGRGPGGEKVTITVESDPITESFNIQANGTWTWSPPVSLAPGAHKVTISWTDGTGITRSIKRTFIVQAGEVPSFEATPSQTLAPSASPSATPSASATPVATPSPTPATTPVPVPVTGDAFPTYLLIILGLAVISYGVAAWKFSDA